LRATPGSRASYTGGRPASADPRPGLDRPAAGRSLHRRRSRSRTHARVGHSTDGEVVLDFIGRAEHPRLAALGTSCPDHFLRTKVRPMVLDLPPTAELGDVVVRLRALDESYRADYHASQ